jgi:hypothetical protein
VQLGENCLKSQRATVQGQSTAIKKFSATASLFEFIILTAWMQPMVCNARLGSPSSPA